jgi:hypothetical protein
VLANFVAELFVILHPATLPMLERMFEDVKQDAETDGCAFRRSRPLVPTHRDHPFRTIATTRSERSRPAWRGV